jgi:prepilin-type processing-associated H-X9-DG protein
MMQNAKRAKRRFAFTVIELLVCIGIVCVLTAMLFPAIAAARSSARKSYCSIRLRELALATTVYESANKRIPPNLTSVYNQWQFHLLPHLEHQSIYSGIVSEVDIYPQSAYAWMTIPSFQCPENADSEFPMRQYVTYFLVGKSDYVGIVGTTSELSDGVFPAYGKGVGGVKSKGVKYSDVLDGLSNTLLFGERPPSKEGTVGSWLRGLTHMNATVAVFDQGPFPIGQGTEPMMGCGEQKFQLGDLSNPCSASHNWSLHAGGAHFAMVDGAVSFFSYSVEERVLRALATRSGGETDSDR